MAHLAQARVRAAVVRAIADMPAEFAGVRPPDCVKTGLPGLYAS